MIFHHYSTIRCFVNEISRANEQNVLRLNQLKEKDEYSLINHQYISHFQYKPGDCSIGELLDDESSGVKHRPTHLLQLFPKDFLKCSFIVVSVCRCLSKMEPKIIIIQLNKQTIFIYHPPYCNHADVRLMFDSYHNTVVPSENHKLVDYNNFVASLSLDQLINKHIFVVIILGEVMMVVQVQQVELECVFEVDLHLNTIFNKIYQ